VRGETAETSPGRSRASVIECCYAARGCLHHQMLSGGRGIPASSTIAEVVQWTNTITPLSNLLIEVSFGADEGHTGVFEWSARFPCAAPAPKLGPCSFLSECYRKCRRCAAALALVVCHNPPSCRATGPLSQQLGWKRILPSATWNNPHSAT
jgi:hypothetical protein